MFFVQRNVFGGGAIAQWIHPAAPGSNPMHTIYGFLFIFKFYGRYICDCVEKRTKINKKGPDGPIF